MTQYTLKLSFDLRQVTQSLGYEFVLQDNSDYAQEGVGPLAGTFNFQQGDEIFVEVVATSAMHPNGHGVTPKDILKMFAVKDCTFISIPQHMTEQMSLFDPSSARASVEAWGPVRNVSTTEDAQHNMQRLSTRSVNPFTVVTKNGQWQISGYLSVALTTANDETHPQLYFFDPEGSAGNGGGWE